MPFAAGAEPGLGRDLHEMHVVVMALRAQSDIDRRFTGASLLGGESATNVLNAFNRAGVAADALAAAGDG